MAPGRVKSPEGSRSGAARGLEWLGTGGVLFLAEIRCLLFFGNELPWELRELASQETRGGVGPEGTMWLDWVGILVLGTVLLGNLIQNRSLLLTPILMWLTGAGFVFWHGLHSSEAMRVGFSWLGATALGLSALHLGWKRTPRKWLIAGLTALLLPLAARTTVQVLFEHPLTVSYYLEHKDEILAQYGWQEGDSEAKRFEGRLLRNDAKGAFVLQIPLPRFYWGSQEWQSGYWQKRFLSGGQEGGRLSLWFRVGWQHLERDRWCSLSPEEG